MSDNEEGGITISPDAVILGKKFRCNYFEKGSFRFDCVDPYFESGATEIFVQRVTEVVARRVSVGTEDDLVLGSAAFDLKENFGGILPKISN